MNEQVSKKFIRMWVEENYNHYDLLPILLNAGRRSRERFEYGIDEAMAFGGDFHLAFYLSVDQLRRSSDDGPRLWPNCPLHPLPAGASGGVNSFLFRDR